MELIGLALWMTFAGLIAALVFSLSGILGVIVLILATAFAMIAWVINEATRERRVGEPPMF
jgi:hypothetical protein